MSTKTKADRLLKIPCGGTKYYCPDYGCYEFDCQYEGDFPCEDCVVTAGKLCGCPFPNTTPPFYNPIDNKRVGKKVLKRIFAIRKSERLLSKSNENEEFYIDDIINEHKHTK